MENMHLPALLQKVRNKVENMQLLALVNLSS